MNLVTWYKARFGKEKVLPSLTTPRDGSLDVRQFSRENCHAYWEIVPTFNGKKWEVLVRIYKYSGGVVDERLYVSPNKEDAMASATRDIVRKMEKYKQ